MTWPEPIASAERLPDRLPDDSDTSVECLCWDPRHGGEWGIGFYDYGAKRWDTTFGWCDCTHWLPLPPRVGG